MALHELRCRNCRNWLGETPVALIFVEAVPKWDPSTSAGDPVQVKPPRDVRLCKSCGHVNVYVPRSSLTGDGAAA